MSDIISIKSKKKTTSATIGLHESIQEWPPLRKLIRSGFVKTRMNEMKELFLFNDILLICDVRVTSKGSKSVDKREKKFVTLESTVQVSNLLVVPDRSLQDRSKQFALLDKAARKLAIFARARDQTQVHENRA